MGRGKTVSRILFEDARDFFKRYENNKTRQIYTFAYKKFIDYCRKEHNAKTKEDCFLCIEPYVEYLQNKHVSDSTLHTYLAACCVYHGVSMKEYKKPKRYTSEYTRGRINNDKKKRNDNDLNNPKYSRLVEFAKRTGLRRAEICRLRGCDFVKDESGNACIFSRRGKGGKQQKQRLLPKDEEFVRGYFDGSDKPVFSKEEMRNKLPLHYLRAKFAQRSYAYYLELAKNPDTKAKLERELRARWNKYNIDPKNGKPKHLPKRLIYGDYHLRGKTREFAIKNNLPTKYNRLALLCTSVYSLSHWRNDVTLVSYLLVI